jgi:diguanylate cyclase (GGDEF)-like protein/PAS domain S-box-containing protein
MLKQAISLLLVEDNALDARLIKEHLLDYTGTHFNITHAERMTEALNILEKNNIDVILLDLSLPDSEWPATLHKMVDCFQYIPTIVLTGFDDEERAVSSIQKGAQDYLIKNDVTPSLLARTIRHAMERHRLKLLVDEASENVRESEMRLRSIINANPDGMAVINQSGILRFINPAMEALLEVQKEIVVGKHFDYGFCVKGCHLSEKSEIEIALSSGRRLYVEAQSSAIKWSEEDACLITFRDITERINSQRRIRLAAQVMESTLDAVFITDNNFAIIEINKAFSDISGFHYDEVKGRVIDFMGAGDYEVSKYKGILKIISESDFYQGEVWNRRKSGEVYAAWLTLSAIKNGSGRSINYAGVFTDITQRKLVEEHLKKMAHYDALTGLPNRALFTDRLDHAIAEAKRAHNKIAVMFIDLDKFKPINDTLGHDIGDIVLAEVANRLRKCIRGSDTVARLGGDEFAVILEDLTNDADAVNVAGKIIETIGMPMHPQGHECSVGASIGIGIYPEHGETANDIVKSADIAMYDVKEGGRNGYKVYEVEGGC